MDKNEDEMETVDKWCVHLQIKSEDEDEDLSVGDKCDGDCDLRRTKVLRRPFGGQRSSRAVKQCSKSGNQNLHHVNSVKNISNKE